MTSADRNRRGRFSRFFFSMGTSMGTTAHDVHDGRAAPWVDWGLFFFAYSTCTVNPATVSSLSVVAVVTVCAN